MLQTYEAILRDGRLEWSHDAPDTRHAVRVHVTVVEPTPVETPEERAARGKRMRELLEKLAETNPFAEITDPVAWQREIRKDRPLPGRDD